MLKRALSIMFLSVVCSGLLWASTLEHNFDQGNQQYIDGDYAGAIGEYNKILRAGFESPELYYNLGNAYFRNGQLGLAIANYTRGRRLSPRDDDIRANLEFAHQFAIDKIEISEEAIILDYINNFFDSFSINEITVVTFILYILTVLVILVRYIYRRYHIYSPVILILVITLSVSLLFAGVKLDRDILTRTGVVLNQQVEVKNGPGDDFSEQFVAHAGLTFKIEREESGYYLVNFENRLKGWIEKSAVAEI